MDFFIMVNNSNMNVPGINTLTDDDRLEMFDTLEDAVIRAEESDYIKWCGYEIFERGKGEG